jgi:hypothetical protein
LDVAGLPKDSKWTNPQLKAWREAKKIASEFGSSIALAAAKTVLSKQSPESKITITELADKTRRSLQCPVQT